MRGKFVCIGDLVIVDSVDWRVDQQALCSRGFRVGGRVGVETIQIVYRLTYSICLF